MNANSAVQDAPVRLVGIGASAGGLEAIGELLSGLPADSGMGYLVVQHLDREHESLLTSILATRTAMKVCEAQDGQRVEPDHVYIIPPNTTMRVVQRHLSLRRRSDAIGPPMPIDDLFESLAKDVGPDAIGVILSGTGSDGALGIQAIKGEGGITFAQDDGSARFSAMPRAAVELGVVDAILPPRAIAQSLARISRHAGSWSDPAASDPQLGQDDEELLQRIFRLLRGACNVDFSHYKRGTVSRRLERRLVLRHVATLSQYMALLESEPSEAQALCRDFLINVTNFFRDPESYEDLAKVVWHRLLDGRSSKMPLRVWVPGCATGEEVYSIAISLLETLGERASGMTIQIFGTDVSDAAVDAARSGRYLENIARDVSPERLQRYFVKLNAHYQIAKRVRDLCIFSRHDVTRDPPFSRVDLLSCRNLLIYLNPQAQTRLMPVFHYALNPNGCLTLGPAETIGTSSDLFRPLDQTKTKIYVRKAGPLRLRTDFGDGSATKRRAERGAVPEEDMPPPLELERARQEADRVALARYAPAGVLCDDELNVVQFRGDTGPYLLHPPGAPSVNLQQLARPGLLVEIGAVIQQAREEVRTVRRTGLRVKSPAGEIDVNLEVTTIQLSVTGQRWFLMFFETADSPEPAVRWLASWGGLWARLAAALSSTATSEAHRESEIARLERNIQAGRDYVNTMLEEHQSAVEELKSAQEELLSSNEEFQSTNEELNTAKEELQSANEELTTTNDELRHRNSQLHELTMRLQEARDYVDAIVETAREPMVVLGPDLRVMRVNQSFCQMFGVTRAESEHSLFYELGTRQWDVPALRELLDRSSLGANNAHRDYEITQTFPSLGERTMLLNARRLNWPDHDLTLLAIEDVTERRAALAAMLKDDQHKNEFLAMLGHELRNPLGAMRNALYVCESPEASPQAKAQALAIISRQLTKENRLVDDLLDLSRITAGVIALERTPVDLSRVITLAAEELQHAMDDHGHELSLALPAGHLFVDGDATRLEQLVANLLGNSAKFTPPGGHVRVTLERDGKFAKLTVADDGIGIAPEALSTVFSLFVQSKGSSDRASGGLGLGLTLVRRLVELHGGTVELRSGGLNRGTQAIVRLPALPQSTALDGAATGDAAALRSSAGPRRVLVVDDNADIAQSVAEVLRMDGHEVETIADGPSAIRSAKTFKPHVVVMDIGLPDMDGHEVARILRSMPETREALLIALSGYGQAADRQRSLAAGFDRHFVKPTEPDVIKALIGTHRSELN